jgi:hypothetical protein
MEGSQYALVHDAQYSKSAANHVIDRKRTSPVRHPIAAIRDTLGNDLDRCDEPHASHTRFLLRNEASTDDPEKAMPPADGPLVLGPGCSPQGIGGSSNTRICSTSAPIRRACASPPRAAATRI